MQFSKIEQITVSPHIRLMKQTKDGEVSYSLHERETVTKDPYPEVGWGICLFEQLSQIREVLVMKNLIGTQCWQAIGFKTVCFGTIIDQKIEKGWLMLQVSWENRKVHTWEKAANLGFEDPQRVQ